MRFLFGPPVFAVEVRSESDYGDPADLARAAKRADYFEAGTRVVWDVDPIADRILRYRFDSPEKPEVFIRGQVADAEPAVPNWTMAVARFSLDSGVLKLIDFVVKGLQANP